METDTYSGRLRGTLVDAEIKELTSGELFLERYRVIRPLGTGTSGQVVLCEDTLLSDLQVAIKLFPSEVRLNERDAARIEQEIFAINRIDHPAVVRFYDCFITANEVGIVMEYLPGGTLKEFLLAKGPLSWRTASDMVNQLAQGLEAIHETGVFHRDLKLENVMLSRNQMLKIADFGLARQFQTSQTIELAGVYHDEDVRAVLKGTRITATGNAVGTPLYMAPEYLESGYFDERSDLYALGVMFFELIAGCPPWSVRSISELVKVKIEKRSPRLDNICDSCPKEVASLVARLLERKPKLRPASATELLVLLQQVDMKLPKNAAILGRRATEGALDEPRQKTERGNRFVFKHTIPILLALLIGCFFIYEYGLSAAHRKKIKMFLGQAGSSNELKGYRVITPSARKDFGNPLIKVPPSF